MIIRSAMLFAGIILLAGIADGNAAGQIDQDMAGHWQCDEGSGAVVRDNSGVGNDGTFLGNPAWGAGVKGAAIVLDGASDVRIAAAKAFGIDKAMTIEVWIKPENKDGRIMMMNSYLNNADRGFILSCKGSANGLSGEGVEFSVMGVDAKRGSSLFQAADLWDGRWHYVAVTCDGNMARLYIDGAWDFSSVVQYGDGIDPGGNVPLFIGGYEEKYGQFRGMIDEVTIWKRALTGDEMRKRYGELKPIP